MSGITLDNFLRQSTDIYMSIYSEEDALEIEFRPSSILQPHVKAIQPTTLSIKSPPMPAVASDDKTLILEFDLRGNNITSMKQLSGALSGFNTSVSPARAHHIDSRWNNLSLD